MRNPEEVCLRSIPSKLYFYDSEGNFRLRVPKIIEGTSLENKLIELTPLAEEFIDLMQLCVDEGVTSGPDSDRVNKIGEEMYPFLLQVYKLVYLVYRD